jgi:hypothetical protein
VNIQFRAIFDFLAPFRAKFDDFVLAHQQKSACLIFGFASPRRLRLAFGPGEEKANKIGMKKRKRRFWYASAIQIPSGPDLWNRNKL